MVEIGVIYSVLRKKRKKIQEEEEKPETTGDDDEDAAAAAAAATEAAAKAEAAAADSAEKATAASERINERVVTEWASALRGHEAKQVAIRWDPQFITSSWKQIPEHVIRDDLILPHQAPAICCEKGHPLKFQKEDRNHCTCDRCESRGEPRKSTQFFSCVPCDFDVCIACWAESNEAFWKVASQDTWSSDKRHKEMKAVCRKIRREKTEVKKELKVPPWHQKSTNDDQFACDGCAETPDVYFEGYQRWKKGRWKPEPLKLCEECYKKRRRKAFLHLRRPWDPDKTAEGWRLLPRDAVLLDHPTRMQVRTAKRRQKSGQTWQQCFKAFSQRKPNVSFNIEFFTHRMEPEKSAKFASDYAERFIVTPPEELPGVVNKRHDEAFPRCLVAHRRRCKKRLQEHPRSGLKGVIPSTFFTHRLDDATAFLQKFTRILSIPACSNDPGPVTTPELGS